MRLNEMCVKMEAKVEYGIHKSVEDEDCQCHSWVYDLSLAHDQPTLPFSAASKCRQFLRYAAILSSLGLCRSSLGDLKHHWQIKAYSMYYTDI